MKKIIASVFLKINLAAVLTLLFAVGSVNGQTFPDGLIGLSSTSPGVLYSIDASNGAATLIVTLNGDASITGLSYLQGTLYGTDLSNFPGSTSFFFDIGSIASDGIITFLGDQNGSLDWHGLASDDCRGNILYTIDINHSIMLTAQFTDGSVVTIGSGAGINGSGMAYDDKNGILYAMDVDGSLYTVSTVTGTSNLIGLSGISNVNFRVGLAYDEIKRILYANVASSGQLFTLDVTSGTATLVGSNGVTGIDGLAWMDDCIVPTEPIPTLSEWGLIAMAGILGIAGFLVMRRRKVTA